MADAPTIDFTVTEEQQLLRETARKWLADRADSERVRALMDTDDGFEQRDWDELVGMGWAALAIPEQHGGAGYGWAEVGVVAEEAGAALLCAPFLSSAVLATAALVAAGTDEAGALLQRLAAGEVRATLAHRDDTTDVTGDGSTVAGTARFVVDGATADVVLVPVGEGDDATLVAIETAQDGVTATALPVLDLTRKQADVSFADANGTVVARGAAVADAITHALQVAGAVLACEQVGGAERVLRDSVQYGKERMQFGRAIGSYQALKHRMAETLKDVEAARSAAYHAVRAMDRDDADERAVATAVAVSWCGEVYERAAGHNIQNHGGIGFTWEHDAHLHFKRAKSSKLLLGGGRRWRQDLADRLGF